MGRSEIACARCGRLTPIDQTAIWEQDEQIRVFQGPAQPEETERDDGHGVDVKAPPRRAVYNRVRKHCAYVTCRKCYAELQAGGSLGDIHNRKVAIFAIALLIVGALIMAFTPVALPTLIAAFWRGDPRM
jgi:hypothetical protein